MELDMLAMERGVSGIRASGMGVDGNGASENGVSGME